MELKNIKDLLETVSKYHTSNISQTFTKAETDWLHVRCIPHTRTLEMTYLHTQKVEYYESIDEMSSVIADQIN